MSINYKKYIIGSMVGLLPRMVAAICLVSTIMDPTLPVFILSCVIIVILTGGSIILHQKFIKKEKERNNEGIKTR